MSETTPELLSDDSSDELIENLREFISGITDAHNDNSRRDFDTLTELPNEYLTGCDEEIYLKEIESITDIGLKYLFQAFLKEFQQEREECIKLYKLASKNNCALATCKLGELYEDIDYVKSKWYYYSFYEDTNNSKFYDEECSSHSDYNNLFESLMSEYGSLRSEKKELREQCKEQEETIKKLQEQITELKYAPNSIGYNECKEHFDSLIKKSK